VAAYGQFPVAAVRRFLLSTLTDAQRTDLGVPAVHRDPTAPPMRPDTRMRLDKDAVGKRISRLCQRMDYE